MHRFRTWMALAPLALMLACGDDGSHDAADAAPIGDGGPTASEPLPCAPCTGDRYDYVGSGTYEVPLVAGDPELAEAAVTPVDSALLRIDDGVITLVYDLPIELTGGSEKVDVSGPLPEGDAPLVLTGEGNTATCYLRDVSAAGFELHCDEQLPGVTIDLAALEIELEGRGLDRALIDQYLEVARLFSEDPIGVFRASMRFDD